MASQSQFGLVQLAQQSQGLLCAALVVEVTAESQTQGPPLSQLQLNNSQAQDALLQFSQQSQHAVVDLIEFAAEPQPDPQLDPPGTE